MADTNDDDRAEYSVCQFFPDGSYEYVRRWVKAEQAWNAFVTYTTNVAAKHGITQRVIITDGGDCINAEWKQGEGLTYPPVKNPHALGN